MAAVSAPDGGHFLASSANEWRGVQTVQWNPIVGAGVFIREGEVMNMRAPLWLTGVMLVVGLLTLAACGGSAGNQPHVAGSAGAPTTKPAADPTAETGTVTVVPAATTYGTAQVISVTVHNGLAGAIFALGNHTGCTSVQLEQAHGAGWQAIAGCMSDEPHPRLLEIKAGTSMTILLTPQQSAGADAAQAADVHSTWPTGTYRAALTYVTSPDEAFSQGVTVSSTPFVIS